MRPARSAAVEMGTTPRYPPGGEGGVLLPPSLCLAYPAEDA